MPKYNIKKSIDDNFWNFITKKKSYTDVIDYKDINKDEYLTELEDNVSSFKHHFSQPLYFYYPKASGILRPIKDYELSDFCVYYYCVKEIQDPIVKLLNEHENVFGGFKLTSEIQKISEKKPYDITYEGFNKTNFREEWSEYQNYAYASYTRDYDFYVHIDIAHFYNDINLDILERDVRGTVKKKEHIIDLLFYFLRNSDKKDLGYFQSSCGLPQEDVSEMSRILANFYLSPIDKYIIEELEFLFDSSHLIHFDYMRYADDMWIMLDCSSVEVVKKALQLISLKLQSIKLHVNEKKLKILNADEFYQYWCFDEWDIVMDKKTKFNDLINLTDNLYKNKNGRWFSPFNYAYKKILKKTNVKNITSLPLAKKLLKRSILDPMLSTKIYEHNLSFYCPS